MVYIEDRISDLESTVKELREEIMEFKAGEKKRKISQVSQEELDKAVAEAVRELKELIEKKAEKEDQAQLQAQLQVIVKEALANHKPEVSNGKGAITEERLAQAVNGIQTAINAKLGTAVTQPQLQQQLNQALQGLTQGINQKVNQHQMAQAVQQSTQIMNQKVQSALNMCQSLQFAVQSNQEQLNHMKESGGLSNLGQNWLDLDLNDQSPFDPTRTYRLRIEDGPDSRWLHSSAVAMGQIHTCCSIS